ncbi:hypothetical protein H6G89_33020 [Oscillatoria sp. FACHB-1407]|uniref:hypothetical protein n=1 Tax=Oscillatoria sp. FACHB-1407 TaxID=2692847 RepID=UPI0016838F89|nr:hypothetical protein [Oscillatoria sp. FACHB-1407]MBD2465812.1 hypothetical protein [Oscillatoria sp. FACHB-1407]
MARFFWLISVWLLGGLFLSSAGVLAYMILGGAYPSDSEWMQNHIEFLLKRDLSLPSPYQIDEAIGGGYYHGLDGRDMWLRFQYVAPNDQSGLPAWSRSGMSNRLCQG